LTTRLVILTGGVGGAKLVLGACQVLDPRSVTAIVNTGDDFRHLGLHVSPDLDTLLYTLAGKSDPERGWGRASETWSFMDAVASLGGDTWFQLGDGDLALHVLRTAKLAQGDSLSQVTAEFARRWGLEAHVLPMSDDPVATKLVTEEGELDFQRYFVERRCIPPVSAAYFEGSDDARPAPGVTDAILGADAILIAPSNPFLSIDPILSVRGISDALLVTSAPIVAVSPIIGGRAVKGPTAKLMLELGLEVTQQAIARHYAGVIQAMLIDESDEAPSIASDATSTMMVTLEDRARVARAALALAERVRRLGNSKEGSGPP
jgi:LPPG:FO 2-phospho-L-lactate transferase